MNCSEFENELERLVESRKEVLSDRAALHAVKCTGCGQRWHDHRLIGAALLAWRPVASPPSLVDSVLARLIQEPIRPVTSHVNGRTRWMVVAMAAACLMAVLGIGLTGPGSRDRSLSQRNNSLPVPITEPLAHGYASTEVASSMAAVMDDLRTEYRELAAETSATAREFAVALPAAPVNLWSDVGLPDLRSKPVESTDVQSPDGVAGKDSPGAVSVIGRSIGTQIGQAMDFLWVAAPVNVPRG